MSAELNNKEKGRPGIVILSGLLAITAAGWLMTPAVHYAVYQEMFQHLPGRIIMVRYIFSVSSRVVGLMAGIGILYRKNIFRILGIALCVSTVISMPWKHPAVLFERAANHVDLTGHPGFLALQQHGFTLLDLAMAGRILLSVAEVCFALCFIFYFTRPGVKKAF